MRVLFLSAFVVLVDQLSKLYVKGISLPFLGIDFKGMRYGETFDVIGSFFQITFVENFGMAFGIEVNSVAKLILSLFTIVASIGILYYLYLNRNKSQAERIALALIFAGAVGNLIDRVFYGVIFDYAPLFYGKVVDFFNVDFFDFSLFGRNFDRWPIFNVADASVTVGVILLLIFHKASDSIVAKNNESDAGSENVLVAEGNDSQLPLNSEMVNSDGNDNRKTDTD